MTRPSRSQRLRALLTTLAFLGTALGLTVLFVGIGGGLPSLGRTYTLRVMLSTAASLTPGSRVTMAGVQVGTVTALGRAGDDAIATIQLTQKSVYPVADNTRFQVRQHTPLGENYIALYPGTAKSKIPPGGILPASQDDDYVDVDQLLSTLQGTTEQRTRQLIQAVGGALNAHGAPLNDAIGATSSVLLHGSDLTHLLDADRQQISTLIQTLGSLAGQVAQRGAELNELASGGIRTFDAVASEDGAVRSFLRQLPQTLTDVHSTTNTLVRVTSNAAPVISDLGDAVEQLRPAVTALDPAAHAGIEVMHQLGPAAPELQRTLTLVKRLASPAPSALAEMHKTLCQVNPMLTYFRPYTPDLLQTIVGLGSATNAYDGLSHEIRATITVNDDSLVGLPSNIEAAMQTLIHSGLIGTYAGQINWDPYPAPGQVGKGTAIGSRDYEGPAQFAAESGYKYPHILASC